MALRKPLEMLTQDDVLGFLQITALLVSGILERLLPVRENEHKLEEPPDHSADQICIPKQRMRRK